MTGRQGGLRERLRQIGSGFSLCLQVGCGLVMGWDSWCQAGAFAGMSFLFHRIGILGFEVMVPVFCICCDGDLVCHWFGC